MIPLLACMAALAVQCPDPSTPTDGFAYDELLNQQVLLSDGATTAAVARWPQDPPGECGWPLLVLTHGLFGSKASLGAVSREYAAAGYFVVSYDVRGHAASTGYHTLWGQRERLDLVEIVRWAARQGPGAD